MANLNFTPGESRILSNLLEQATAALGNNNRIEVAASIGQAAKMLQAESDPAIPIPLQDALLDVQVTIDRAKSVLATIAELEDAQGRGGLHLTYAIGGALQLLEGANIALNEDDLRDAMAKVIEGGAP